MNEALNEIFAIDVIRPIEVVSVDGRAIIAHDRDDVDRNVDDDYATTRVNLHSMLEHGHNALTRALEVALASEHPTAFEVVGGLMKQLADINAQLLELSEKRIKLKQAVGKGTGPTNVTNNAIFVGTAAELGKIIRGE